ncbi:MAG: recombination mediator RecR [Rhodobacteraceae bacterium]|nr:recombination mediator RecR [Paracoccaceae bacterium]
MNQELKPIRNLIDQLARLPGLGPVSSRRIVLDLLKSRNGRMSEIATAMQNVAASVKNCSICGNFSADDICPICVSAERSSHEICVVQDVSDLWAMERAGAFKGRYHILGGLLSMLDHIGPEELRIPALLQRVAEDGIEEVVLALSATVDGQTTAHYIAGQLSARGVRVTQLGQGMPMGGELDLLDGGTITAAMISRRPY